MEVEWVTPATEAPADGPEVTVGVADAAFDDPPPFDVLLSADADPPAPWVGCPEGVDAALAELTAADGDAAAILVQVLRLGAGLVAESLAYSTLQSGPRFREWLASRPAPRPVDEPGPPVLLDRRGDVLEITLNRPPVRNAYNAAMRDGLVAALELAEIDQSLRVELRGAGPSFCSGGDLAEFGTAPDPATAHIVRTTRSAGRLLARLRDRTTAYLHGACVGAGIELPAFAGRVVAAPDTFCLLPEVGMGLIPGAGGTVSIPARIGRERTAFMALTGRAIDAETARRWGLVDVVDGVTRSR